MQIFDDQDVLALISAENAVPLITRAYAALGTGSAYQSVKQTLPAGDSGFFLSLAATVPDFGYAITKWGSYIPGDHARPGVSSSTILVSASDGGEPVALVQGMAVTIARTAAATAAIVRRFAPDASRVVLIGYGPINRAVEAALAATCSFTSGTILTRSGKSHSPRLEAMALPGARDAVGSADIVISATGAHSPVADLRWLAPGALAISLDGAATWAGHDDAHALSDHDDARLPSLARAFAQPPTYRPRFIDSAGSGVADVAVCRLLMESTP